MTIRPGIYLACAIVLTIVFSFICIVYAEESTTVSLQDSPMVGTWTDANYTLSLSQNGSIISGIATVSQPGFMVVPFQLAGTLSEDGKTLQCIVNQTGTLTLNLSEDKMMFIGTGAIDQLDNSSKPYTYMFNGTRNGTPIISGQEWTGTWAGKKNLINLTQTNTSVSGEYHPLTNLQYKGLLQGTTSADGKTLTMVYVLPVNDSFSLSDDGKNILEGECTDKKISVNGYCLNLTKMTNTI
jgi:hypothetical protein